MKTICPHCHKPFSSTNESAADTLPDQPAGQPGILADAVRYTVLFGLSSTSIYMALALSDLDRPAYWLAPLTGLILTAGIDVLKIYLYRPARPDHKPTKPDQPPVQLTIKSTDNRQILLPDLDNTIRLDQLLYIAYKVQRGNNFSRPALCKPGLISQDQYRLIAQEFSRLGLIEKKPNNANGYLISPAGQDFMKKIVAVTTNNNQQRG